MHDGMIYLLESAGYGMVYGCFCNGAATTSAHSAITVWYFPDLESGILVHSGKHIVHRWNMIHSVVLGWKLGCNRFAEKKHVRAMSISHQPDGFVNKSKQNMMTKMYGNNRMMLKMYMSHAVNVSRLAFELRLRWRKQECCIGECERYFKNVSPTPILYCMKSFSFSSSNHLKAAGQMINLADCNWRNAVPESSAMTHSHSHTHTPMGGSYQARCWSVHQEKSWVQCFTHGKGGAGEMMRKTLDYLGLINPVHHSHYSNVLFLFLWFLFYRLFLCHI